MGCMACEWGGNVGKGGERNQRAEDEGGNGDGMGWDMGGGE